jgi:hypothetical protein
MHARVRRALLVTAAYSSLLVESCRKFASCGEWVMNFVVELSEATVFCFVVRRYSTLTMVQQLIISD